jgi:hypothetical protein
MSLWETNAAQIEQAAANRPPMPNVPREPSIGENFWSGAGSYFMRSLAETGRAASMAFSAVPVALDKAAELRGERFEGGPLQERYFRWHDEAFGNAVDYWTPKPHEVGAAGQVVGSLAGGLVQFFANPALMVGTNMLSTSEDLVRQGVDADAAVLAGDVAGLFTVAGIALPIFGKSLGQRMAAGALGNFATNIPEAAIKREVVRAAGAPLGVAEQFDPWDMRARLVDTLLGVAFGAKAHLDAKLTANQRDAVMTLNAARHLEEASSPGRPQSEAELTANVARTKQALEQLLRGDPVRVDGETTMPKELSPERAEVARLVERELRPMTGEPIKLPEPAARPDAEAAAQGKPRDLQAEMIQGRKTQAVLARLLECLG